MELTRNATAPDALPSRQTARPSPLGGRDGNAYLYVVTVVSFCGVFLTGIGLGYLRSKRRSSAFTRLLHEEEQREWGASQKKRRVRLPAPVTAATGRDAGGTGRDCALCSGEQSSVSSTADVRFAIEEEPLTGEGREQPAKTNRDETC